MEFMVCTLTSPYRRLDGARLVLRRAVHATAVQPRSGVCLCWTRPPGAIDSRAAGYAATAIVCLAATPACAAGRAVRDGDTNTPEIRILSPVYRGGCPG